MLLNLKQNIVNAASEQRRLKTKHAPRRTRFLRVGYLSVALILTANVIVPTNTSLGNAFAADIQKCQDADGNWHYGTHASFLCGDGDIDQLDATGTKTGVDKPPPSAEELKKIEDQKTAIEQAKLSKKQQRESDLEIIRTYGSEETIISTLDRKLESIDKNIQVTRKIKEGTLSDLEKLKKLKQTKKNKAFVKEREDAIKSYNRVIRNNLTMREQLSEQYITILSDFREAHGRIYTK